MFVCVFVSAFVCVCVHVCSLFLLFFSCLCEMSSVMCVCHALTSFFPSVECLSMCVRVCMCALFLFFSSLCGVFLYNAYVRAYMIEGILVIKH